MIDKSGAPLSLIGVQTPSPLLVLLNHAAYLLVMPNLDAFPFFQINITFLAYDSKISNKGSARRI